MGDPEFDRSGGPIRSHALFDKYEPAVPIRGGTNAVKRKC